MQVDCEVISQVVNEVHESHFETMDQINFSAADALSATTFSIPSSQVSTGTPR